MNQEVVELTEKIDKCNVDLKTACNDIGAKENEKEKLHENLTKVSTKLYVNNFSVLDYLSLFT